MLTRPAAQTPPISARGSRRDPEPGGNAAEDRLQRAELHHPLAPRCRAAPAALPASGDTSSRRASTTIRTAPLFHMPASSEVTPGAARTTNSSRNIDSARSAPGAPPGRRQRRLRPAVRAPASISSRRRTGTQREVDLGVVRRRSRPADGVRRSAAVVSSEPMVNSPLGTPSSRAARLASSSSRLARSA